MKAVVPVENTMEREVEVQTCSTVFESAFNHFGDGNHKRKFFFGDSGLGIVAIKISLSELSVRRGIWSRIKTFSKGTIWHASTWNCVFGLVVLQISISKITRDKAKHRKPKCAKAKTCDLPKQSTQHYIERLRHEMYFTFHQQCSRWYSNTDFIDCF